MARRVKLQDTGEYGTNETAYKAPNNKYYSNEEAYLLFVKAKEDRQRCIDKMYDIMDYTPQMKLPTFFYKKLAELEGLGFDTVYDTLNGQFSSINWALNNKPFGSETSKVMYIMAIVNNHIMDYYKRNVAEKRRQVVKNSSEDFNDVEVVNRTKKTKDIRRFLDE